MNVDSAHDEAPQLSESLQVLADAAIAGMSLKGWETLPAQDLMALELHITDMSAEQIGEPTTLKEIQQIMSLCAILIELRPILINSLTDPELLHKMAEGNREEVLSYAERLEASQELDKRRIIELIELGRATADLTLLAKVNGRLGEAETELTQMMGKLDLVGAFSGDQEAKAGNEPILVEIEGKLRALEASRAEESTS